METEDPTEQINEQLKEQLKGVQEWVSCFMFENQCRVIHLRVHNLPSANMWLRAFKRAIKVLVSAGACLSGLCLQFTVCLVFQCSECKHESRFRPKVVKLV